MSNSPLVDFVKISPNKNSPRKADIVGVVIHCMAGNMTVESCGAMFANPERQASSNYGIGSDGKIGLYVDERDRSWCTSSGYVDHRCITIEVANIENKEPYRISQAAYDSLIKLLVDICRRNNIPKLIWKADESLKQDFSKQNMTVHRWFANKSCPGEYLYSIHGQIAEAVNRKLGGIDKGLSFILPDYNNSPVITDNVTLLDIQHTIDYTQFNPYIMTIDRNTGSINYVKMKTMKVSGVMIEAGCLYDNIHREIFKCRNPKAEKQADEVVSNKLPLAWYWTCRAHNVKEAEKEMYQFSFLLRKYPPTLCAWLKLEFIMSISTNDKILNKYCDVLEKLGLKNQIGIYVTRNQLKKITWKNFKDKLFLWLDDHTDSVNEFDRLLDPEFFNVDTD